MQKIILSLILLASSKSFAASAPPHHLPEKSTKSYAEVEALPVRLVKLHLNSIDEGQCMKIEDQLETVEAYSWQVDDYTTMFAVPCAMWAHNQTWKFYAEFNEPKEDGHGLFRRMQFSSVDWGGRMIGGDLIYDWMWSADSKSLATVFFYNGRSDCGSLHQYTWNDVDFDFELISSHMKTKCDGDTSAWPEVPLPKAP